MQLATTGRPVNTDHLGVRWRDLNQPHGIVGARRPLLTLRGIDLRPEQFTCWRRNWPPESVARWPRNELEWRALSASVAGAPPSLRRPGVVLGCGSGSNDRAGWSFRARGGAVDRRRASGLASWPPVCRWVCSEQASRSICRALTSAERRAQRYIAVASIGAGVTSAHRFGMNVYIHQIRSPV